MSSTQIRSDSRLRGRARVPSDPPDKLPLSSSSDNNNDNSNTYSDSNNENNNNYSDNNNDNSSNYSDNSNENNNNFENNITPHLLEKGTSITLQHAGEDKIRWQVSI